MPHIAVLKALEKMGGKFDLKTREGEANFLSKKFTSMSSAEKVAQVIVSVEQEKYGKFSRKNCLYLGSKIGPERAMAKQWGIPYQAIATGKWRRYLDWENIGLNVRDLIRIKIGIFQAIFAVRRFNPDVIFSKGGYVSVPVLIAGWVLRVPIVIHDSDAIPGMTTR
ncbi:MAG: glycosyltransferase, partial [Candidatus Margulisiibacteriota bacterium]